MNKSTASPRASAQFLIRTGLFMGGYLLLNAAALTAAFDDATGAAGWGLGLVASGPVIGQIWALLAFMRDSDEFIRGIMARRFILASGITVALFSAWGFLEFYAQARPAPAFLIYPLLWVVFAMISPFVRSTR